MITMTITTYNCNHYNYNYLLIYCHYVTDFCISTGVPRCRDGIVRPYIHVATNRMVYITNPLSPNDVMFGNVQVTVNAGVKDPCSTYCTHS